MMRLTPVRLEDRPLTKKQRAAYERWWRKRQHIADAHARALARQQQRRKIRQRVRPFGEAA